jgi:DNA-binding NarL/FixJ family response regulator
MSAIRILLADDQTIIREGIRSLLSSHADLFVAGEACNGEEAVAQAQKLKPDVVLMDIRMPKMNGVEATRLIKGDLPETVVIVLTTFDDDEYVIKAMTFGASGYLLKDIGSDKLVEAIRDGMNGSIILPGRIAAKITSRLAQNAAPNAQSEDFTQREVDIIRLMAAGKSNGEIAQALYLTVGTVKNYISQIYMKLNVSDRANAVIAFKKMGF